MQESISFNQEVDANKNAAEVSNQIAGIETAASSLEMRLRGAFITDCELTSPTSGVRIDVLYSETDLTKPKITATHPMVPAGPYDGVGGQHGFPRWSDYHEFPLEDGANGEKRMAIQAKRSDNGLSLTKAVELTESSVTTHTTIRSSDEANERTSMGEHLYFSLTDEDLTGLTINGQSINELLGDGSEDIVKNDGTLYWNFGGEAVIKFPAGHTIKLSAAFEGTTEHPLALWIWKRSGSPSICLEPIVGVEHLDEDDTAGVQIQPYSAATLSTKIELL